MDKGGALGDGQAVSGGKSVDVVGGAAGSGQDVGVAQKGGLAVREFRGDEHQPAAVFPVIVAQGLLGLPQAEAVLIPQAFHGASGGQEPGKQILDGGVQTEAFLGSGPFRLLPFRSEHFLILPEADAQVLPEADAQVQGFQIGVQGIRFVPQPGQGLEQGAAVRIGFLLRPGGGRPEKEGGGPLKQRVPFRIQPGKTAGGEAVQGDGKGRGVCHGRQNQQEAASVPGDGFRTQTFFHGGLDLPGVKEGARGLGREPGRREGGGGAQGEKAEGREQESFHARPHRGVEGRKRIFSTRLVVENPWSRGRA